MNYQEFRELSPSARERLLKRLLPALAIGVIYLTFVGPYINRLTNTARTETTELRFPGPIEAIRGPIDLERQKLDGEQNALKKAKEAYERWAGESIGFLSQTGYADLVVQRLGHVLEHNRMSVISENRAQLTKVQKRLPVSVEEVARFALAQIAMKTGGNSSAGKDGKSPAATAAPKETKPAAGSKLKETAPEITVWTLKIRGSYLDMYRTLRDLNQDPLQVITVMLDMTIPEGAIDPEWNLVLWI